MYHASYAYPSEVLPFVELVLTLLAMVVLLAPHAASADSALASAWQRFTAIPERTAVATSTGIALLASAASMLALGWPVAHVADEFGHLLVADTLAHGRLSNPAPRVPAAFENVYAIVQPSYASKYPPVQGAALALGQALGHPGIGVTLSVALLAAACCWFLGGWLPRPWPLVVTTLLTLRVGLGSYWGQSYWGGAMTAIGGMLLYGALPRWLERSSRPDDPRNVAGAWPAVAFALGGFLLVNSRPLEGTVACLPAVAVLAVAWLRGRVGARTLRPVVLIAGVAAAVGCTALYNRAVTGNALEIPYHLHNVAYGEQGPIPFVAPPPPVHYSSPVLAAHLATRFPRPGLRKSLTQLGQQTARFIGFVCALPLLLGVVLALRRPRGWVLYMLACCALQLLIHASTQFWSPHYVAAATGPLLLLGGTGLRHLATVRWRGAVLGAWIPAAALAVQLPLAIIELPAHRPDNDDWSRTRARVESDLERAPQPSVVVVDDRLREVHEWVCNRADLASARVLWIQDLGSATTRAVAVAYGRHRVFRLSSGGADRAPRLEPVALAP